MYEDLLQRVREINEQVVFFRLGGEYMSSARLQEMCIFMLGLLCKTKSITSKQKKMLIKELQKR